MLFNRIRSLSLHTKISFRLIVLLLSLLCAFCIWRIAMPCESLQMDKYYYFESGTPTSDTVVFDQIALKPGVYDIRLQYETDTDLVGMCSLKDGTVFTGGLLTNGEHLYSALHETSYNAWLYESTEALEVTVSYGGEGNLVVTGLTVVETNLLWTKLLAVFLFWGLAALAVLTFYCYQQKYPLSESQKKVLFFCTVIGFIASIPYLHEGLIGGADLTYHLQRIEGVKDGLLGGQFPVRLEPRWVYDHGYANGIFYCNALLYFPALLRMIGFTVTESYSIYCIVLNFATVWIAWFCFGRMFGDDTIGLLCSGLYTLSVFRIYKLVITGAMGEGSAYTFFPLIAYGLYLAFTADSDAKRSQKAWLPLAIGYAGLIQTHVLTCEITAFLTILICLVFIRKIFRLPVFWALCKGALAALGLSMWYLIPFLDYYLTQDVHIRHISARTIQDRGLLLPQLAFQFWRSGLNTPQGDNGMQYSHPVGVGLILIIGLLVFAAMAFCGVWLNVRDNRKKLACTAAAFGALLLLMSLNRFPWDQIQNIHPAAASLVSSLQFPNRFLGWGTACLVIVCGFLFWYWKHNGNVLFSMSIVVLVVGIATSYVFLMDSVDREQDYLELYNQESMGFGYVSGAEYLIEGTDQSLLTFADPEGEEAVTICSYEKRGLRAELVCANSAGHVSYVDLPILLYKGYRATDMATGTPLTIDDSNNHTLRLWLPAAWEGSVSIEFIEPLHWRLGELITLLTMIGLIGLPAAAIIKRRRYLHA